MKNIILIAIIALFATATYSQTTVVANKNEKVTLRLKTYKGSIQWQTSNNQNLDRLIGLQSRYPTNIM